MSRNRLLVVALVLGAVAFVPATSHAQTATANLTVTASIARKRSRSGFVEPGPRARFSVKATSSAVSGVPS